MWMPPLTRLEKVEAVQCPHEFGRCTCFQEIGSAKVAIAAGIRQFFIEKRNQGLYRNFLTLGIYYAEEISSPATPKIARKLSKYLN